MHTQNDDQCIHMYIANFCCFSQCWWYRKWCQVMVLCWLLLLMTTTSLYLLRCSLTRLDQVCKCIQSQKLVIAFIIMVFFFLFSSSCCVILLQKCLSSIYKPVRHNNINSTYGVDTLVLVLQCSQQHACIGTKLTIVHQTQCTCWQINMSTYFCT